MNSEKWQTGKKDWNNGGQIRQFYAGKRILLTGCTGFFGTGIVDKLLRTCLEIDKIYLIIRTKTNMTIKQRMEKYFEDPVFERLHKTNPNFMEKVQPIYGDLQKVNLGLSLEDYKLLTENVDIIIHNGADISFFTRISSILKTNGLGTKYMLDLAANCANIKAFVYVSSTYCHSYNSLIEEKFYSPPGDINMIEDLIREDELTANGFDKITLRKKLGKWYNTYIFSKAFAEGLVEEFARRTSIVCGVFRPALIVSSYEEPVPGWIAGKGGLIVVILAFYKGLIHTLPMKDDAIINIVPVDMAVNSLLACVWDLCTRKKSDGPQIYNYSSSCWNPCYNKVYKLTSSDRAREYPFNDMYWYPFLISTGNYYIYILLHMLLHVIPSAVYDFGCWIVGKKGRGLKIASKISRYHGTINYAFNHNWIIEVKNVQNILVHMNEADYKEFPFDFGKVDWQKFMRDFTRGIKVHLCNESKDSILAAKKRFRELMIIHYTVCACFSILAVVLLFRMICTFCC